MTFPHHMCFVLGVMSTFMSVQCASTPASRDHSESELASKVQHALHGVDVTDRVVSWQRIIRGGGWPELVIVKIECVTSEACLHEINGVMYHAAYFFLTHTPGVSLEFMREDPLWAGFGSELEYVRVGADPAHEYVWVVWNSSAGPRHSLPREDIEPFATVLQEPTPQPRVVYAKALRASSMYAFDRSRAYIIHEHEPLHPSHRSEASLIRHGVTMRWIDLDGDARQDAYLEPVMRFMAPRPDLDPGVRPPPIIVDADSLHQPSLVYLSPTSMQDVLLYEFDRNGDGLPLAREPELSCEKLDEFEQYGVIEQARLIKAYATQATGCDDVDERVASYLQRHLETFTHAYDTRRALGARQSAISHDEVYTLSDAGSRQRDVESSAWLGDLKPELFMEFWARERVIDVASTAQSQELWALLRALALAPRSLALQTWARAAMSRASTFEEVSALIKLFEPPVISRDVSPDGVAALVRDALQIITKAMKNGSFNATSFLVVEGQGRPSALQRADLVLWSLGAHHLRCAAYGDPLYELAEHIKANPNQLNTLVGTGAYRLLAPTLIAHTWADAQSEHEYMTTHLPRHAQVIVDAMGRDGHFRTADFLDVASLRPRLEAHLARGESREVLTTLANMPAFLRIAQVPMRVVMQAGRDWIDAHPAARRDDEFASYFDEAFIFAMPWLNEQEMMFWVDVLSDTRWLDHDLLRGMGWIDGYPSGAWQDNLLTAMESVEHGGLLGFFARGHKPHNALFYRMSKTQQMRLEVLYTRELDREADLLEARLRSGHSARDRRQVIHLLEMLRPGHQDRIQETFDALLVDDTIWPERCEFMNHIHVGFYVHTRCTPPLRRIMHFLQ